MDIGAAVVTEGGPLAADYLIYAVVSSPSNPPTVLGVKRAIQSVLERSNDWEFKRIAIPLLAGTPAELGVDTAARILSIRSSVAELPRTPQKCV